MKCEREAAVVGQPAEPALADEARGGVETPRPNLLLQAGTTHRATGATVARMPPPHASSAPTVPICLPRSVSCANRIFSTGRALLKLEGAAGCAAHEGG